MGFFQKPFGYEPILTKEDLRQSVKKKKSLVRQIRKTHCYDYGKLLMSNECC